MISNMVFRRTVVDGPETINWELRDGSQRMLRSSYCLRCSYGTTGIWESWRLFKPDSQVATLKWTPFFGPRGGVS